MEQRLDPGAWPRHRHATAYAAVVLSGGYLEAGGAGRWRAGAGDVLAHPAFDAHQNVLTGRAWVLNIPLPAAADLPPVFRVADLDTVERAYRTDPAEAARLLIPARTRAPLIEDWPDLLAAALGADPTLSIGSWARAHGLAPAVVSRGFRATFGVTPAAFRVERRTGAAWRDLTTTVTPLAAIAHDRGFADQAHLSRSIRALTGASPRIWRQGSQLVNSVQEAADALH